MHFMPARHVLCMRLSADDQNVSGALDPLTAVDCGVYDGAKRCEGALSAGFGAFSLVFGIMSGHPRVDFTCFRSRLVSRSL